MNCNVKILLIVLCFSCFILLENCKKDNSFDDNNKIDTIGDITIGYIQRLPTINFVDGSENATRDGWPEIGQNVIWQAHVKNWAGVEKHNVKYIWKFDGEKVDSGFVDIPALDEVTIDYPWSWEFERHTLELIIDPERKIKESVDFNNNLLIYTNAITIGYYVEQKMYDYFHKYQCELGIGSNSFEDWAQRQVRLWNKMCEEAIYPETPNGVIDRLRVDKITIVEDHSMEGYGFCINSNDSTVDLLWGIPYDFNMGDIDLFNSYEDHYTISSKNPFYFDRVIFHELGHTRYLIDLYAFNVHHNRAVIWNGNGDLISGSWIDIRENDELVAGSKYMPRDYTLVYEVPDQGLMHSNWSYIDRYSAIALNLIAGQRTIFGADVCIGYKSNLGEYTDRDLPSQNQLTIKNKDLETLSNAKVSVYQHTSPGYYGKYYDNIPDYEFTANNNGEVILPKDPFPVVERETLITLPNGEQWLQKDRRQATLIIRVEHEGKIGYGFLPAYLFNMEYWQGNTELGKYDLIVELQ